MKGNGEPPSPTVGAASAVTVVGADEQQPGDARVDVDVDRWCRLAALVLEDEGRRGELTLTFVDRDEIAALNAEHMGKDGPTDVLSFPLDALDDDESDGADVPVLLGDVVVCPAVAREQAPDHAGSLDDELALLVVHGVLHVVGHDHVDPEETAAMRGRELELLTAHHWDGRPSAGFRQDHIDDTSGDES
jgi:probable rRNA maturation factor